MNAAPQRPVKMMTIHRPMHKVQQPPISINTSANVMNTHASSDDGMAM